MQPQWKGSFSTELYWNIQRWIFIKFDCPQSGALHCATLQKVLHAINSFSVYHRNAVVWTGLVGDNTICLAVKLCWNSCPKQSHCTWCEGALNVTVDKKYKCYSVTCPYYKDITSSFTLAAALAVSQKVCSGFLFLGEVGGKPWFNLLVLLSPWLQGYIFKCVHLRFTQLIPRTPFGKILG